MTIPAQIESPAPTTPNHKALLIVDVQHDFCPGGSLATTRGDEVAAAIGAFQRTHSSDYDQVVTTQDWHIDPAGHFSSQPDFTDTWPVHCVAGSHGAALHPDIDAAGIDAFFHKGQYTAAYSGFEGRLAVGSRDADANDARGAGDASTAPDSQHTPLLAEWLRERGITAVDIVGIATDHCVRATALDAVAEGFEVTVLADMCSAVSDERAKKTFAELREAGAKVESTGAA